MNAMENGGFLTPGPALAPDFRLGRRFRRTAAGWLIALVLGGCSAESDYLRLSGPTMGTQYRVTARCDTPVEALSHAVTAELIAVNAAMSTYDPASELSQFNASPPGDWFPVSAELADVVTAAARVSEESGGAFDVTVGPLVNLWGFGPESAAPKPAAGTNASGKAAGPWSSVTQMPPEPGAIAAARRQVGYRFLSVRLDPPALRKERAMYVDLSAIAKGHGVDRLTRLLDRAGCTDYLVDVGGEVRVRGANPSGTSWRIGVEMPEAGQWGGVQKVLALNDRAVATSGDYRNFVELDDHRFSHTIDPRTGAPVTHSLASVTVIHASAMLADAYATALNVLGPAEALAFAETHALAVYLLIHTQGGFEARYTQPMSEYLVDAQ